MHTTCLEDKIEPVYGSEWRIHQFQTRIHNAETYQGACEVYLYHIHARGFATRRFVVLPTRTIRSPDQQSYRRETVPFVKSLAQAWAKSLEVCIEQATAGL